MQDDEENGSNKVEKIRVPLNNEDWIHRLIGFARRLQDLHNMYVHQSIVRFYDNKIVIEMDLEKIKKFNDLIASSVDGIEIKETDKDSDLAVFNQTKPEPPK